MGTIGGLHYRNNTGEPPAMLLQLKLIASSIVPSAILAIFLFGTVAFATTVTNTSDSGPGSLRQAIMDTPSSGSIDFALKGCPCSIVLTSGPLIIVKNLAIHGPINEQLTISGNNTFRVFQLDGTSSTSRIAVIFSRLRIVGGRSLGDSGGGIRVENTDLTISNSSIENSAIVSNGFTAGAGIASFNSTLTLSDTTISGNTAQGGFPSIGVGAGVAAFTSTLSIIRSNISNNVSSDGATGIYANGGVVKIIDSTIANNRGGQAAAMQIFFTESCLLSGSTIENNLSDIFAVILLSFNKTISITNTTISGNRATTGTGGIIHENWNINDQNPTVSRLSITNSTIANNVGTYEGGGVITAQTEGYSATTEIRGTIIAGNSSTASIPDVWVDAVAEVKSLGYNLIGNVGIVDVFNQPGDQAGTPSSPLDARLEPLALNGGATRTHALKLTSPALDKGKSFGLITDQRGMPRPIDNPNVPNAHGGDGSDIGAYEMQFPVLSSVTISGRAVTSSGDPLRRGAVLMTDAAGVTRYGLINPFGHFRFTGVPSGTSVTLYLRVKNWSSPSQSILVTEAVNNLVFTGVRDL